MKKVFALLSLALLAACTPQQLARFEQSTGVDITPADETTLIALPDHPMRLDATHFVMDDGSIWEQAVSGPCSEWYATAMSVGWSPAQWSTLKQIMYRESRCQPGAHNRSGATGLIQIMPMWADDCGGTPSMLFDPTFTLSCGLHILHVQGWRAWSTYR